MSETDSNNYSQPPQLSEDDIPEIPQVNALTFTDIQSCFSEGLEDFRKAPAFGIFFGSVYALIGIFIFQSLFVWQKAWMMYPMLIGFPLIGPFVAVGIYEVSRRLHSGKPLTWHSVLTVVWQQSRRELHWMAFVVLFIFWIWMYQVRLLIALILGRMSFATLGEFIEVITTTPEGIIFIIIGHVVGACFALLLFSTTVISFPILLEREMDFISAMITSFKTVLASPFVMLSWGVFVTIAVLLSFLPMFLGLIFVLPILGHTTWHIYKSAIED